MALCSQGQEPLGYRNVSDECPSNYEEEGPVLNMTTFFTGNLNIVSDKQKPHSAVLPNTTGTYSIQGFKNKTWFTHTIESYSATERNEELIHAKTWMNLESIRHSGSSQTQEATYRTIPFIRNVKNRQVHSDCQGLQEKGEWGVTANGDMGFPFECD